MKNKPLIQQNAPLKKLNTFDIEANSEYLVSVQPPELIELLAKNCF